MRSLTRLCSVGAILIVLLTPGFVLAQAQVRNVRVERTSDFKVEVTYDLQGLGDQTATVKLLYSRGGGSFREARRVEGDVEGIGEGQGHRIVWDPEEEVGAVRGEKFVFKVEAKLPEPISGGKPEEGTIPPPPLPPSGEALVFLTTDQDGLTVELFLGAKVVQQGPLGAGSPFQAILKPGHYRLRVTKAEHHPYEKGFELMSEQLFREKVNLVAAYGWLDLTVVPEDAYIVVDNASLPGGGGTRSIKLSEGTHRVEVTAGEKWVPAPPREVRIPDGGQRRSLRIELEPRFGTLVLETEPSGAQVTLNGADVGKTPFRDTGLLAGQYEVCLELALYDRQCFAVEMVTRGKIERTVKLSPNFGELSLRGSPTGASVFRRGEQQPMGSLPVEGLRLPPGSYSFEVKSEPQFDPERVVVEVPKGKAIAREIHLKRRVGRLQVVSDPPTEGATVRINGREVGKTPYTSEDLPTGTAEVEVESGDRIGKMRVEVEARVQKPVVVAIGPKELPAEVTTGEPTEKVGIERGMEEINRHFDLGVLHQREGRMVQALEEYKEVLRFSPSHVEAHNNLGTIYRKMGRYEEAQKELERAIALNPSLASAYYNLGVVFQLQGNLQGAVKHYRRALELNPNNANTYNNLGVVYKDLNQLAAARGVLEKALSLNPSLPQTFYNLALVEEADGNREEAVSLYRRFIELSQTLPQNSKEREVVEKVRLYLLYLTTASQPEKAASQ